jgi:hypothetical protein
MEKSKKWPILMMGGLLVLMLSLIGSIALAQDTTPEAETPAQEQSESGSARIWRGLGHWGGFGHGDSADSNWLENLAEALGITVQQLEEAQEQAYAASVADAVAAGQITQEQADQILANRALKSYIDRRTILATALGMTADELEAALAEGQSMSDLMDEKGIDAATLQTNAQAAYEAAVQQAVTDGVITQAQADDILAEDGFNLFGHGGRGSHHGGGRGGRGGHGFFSPMLPDSTTPDTTVPETTDTSLDA